MIHVRGSFKYLIIISFIVISCGILSGLYAQAGKGASHYIRTDAKGKNDGSDWNNAWKSLPDTLQRGHTYYIASGKYGSWALKTPEKGRDFIYIKKATTADHGTGAGWNDTFGKGQAIIQTSEKFVAKIQSSYWEIDGNSDVSDSTYGFKFQALPGGKVDCIVIIIDETWKKKVFSNIRIKHCEIQHRGCDNSKGGGRGFMVHSMAGLENGLLHHVYIHDIPGIPIYFVNTKDSIIEYSHVARNHSDTVSHSEAIQTGGVNPDNTIRYNKFEDIEGTAVIVGDTGWKVYGNLAFYTPSYVNAPQTGRHAPGVLCSNYVGMGFFTTTGGGKRTNCQVYNNTIVGNNTTIKEGGNLGIYLPGEGNVVVNNIWANCRRVRITVPTADYNSIYYSGDGGYKELHLQRFKEDPFVNSAGHDYRLKKNTDPGKQLESEFKMDRYKTTRGINGNWSRGAYQFNSSQGK